MLSSRNRKMPPLSGIAAALILSGCGSLPKVPGKQFLLDTKNGVLCYNSAAQCYALDLIIANSYRDELLRSYNRNPRDQQQLNEPAELITLLLTNSADATGTRRLDPFTYILPDSQQVRTAWRVLGLEYQLRYANEPDR